MTPPPSPNWQQKLAEFETQLRQTLGQQSHPQKLQTLYNQLLGWFQGLPKGGQVAVVVIGVLIGFSVLQTLLQLISLSVSLAVLGVLVYLAYKFVMTSQSSNKNNQ